MYYSNEERIEVGRQIHESGLSNLKAAKLFGIVEETARRYRILYEESAGIPHNPSTSAKKEKDITKIVNTDEQNSLDYESMTKEELIQELMKAKIQEERLKKGYYVKGVGVKKEYLHLDN
ncbi:hypothetical protein [Pseudobutyrivibrio sp.]|jgi:transposase|uniref:hypothetical protein n=1 Tax=Pseudobutyrivibrio sp. TaxID=2014367 RepID=UPI0025D10AD3|nr:hypothetical protein [Pseudobutyrivibrio sp.]